MSSPGGLEPVGMADQLPAGDLGHHPIEQPPNPWAAYGLPHNFDPQQKVDCAVYRMHSVHEDGSERDWQLLVMSTPGGTIGVPFSDESSKNVGGALHRMASGLEIATELPRA